MNKLQEYGMKLKRTNNELYESEAKALLNDGGFLCMTGHIPMDRFESFMNLVYESDLKVSDITSVHLNLVDSIRVNKDTLDITENDVKLIDSYALSEFFNNGTPPQQTKDRVLNEIQERHENEN